MVEFSKVIGIFGPVLTVQIHEAPLNYGRKELPHGNLDILVVSPVSNTRMGVLIIDGVSDQVLLTGSMKTEDSIDSPSSGEYVCCGYMWCCLRPNNYCIPFQTIKALNYRS